MMTESTIEKTTQKKRGMKLKTRLKIAFCAIILGPVLLLCIFFLGFGHAKVRSMEETYGMEFSLNFFVNSAQTMNESTQKVWNEMQSQAAEDPDRFLNYAYLQDLNGELKGRLSYLVMVKGQEIYYQGKEGDLSAVVPLLPAYDEAADDGNGIYIDHPLKAMVKKVDLLFSDGTSGVVYIITAATAIVPHLRRLAVQVGLAMVLILLITALGMTFWIYKGINEPIQKLQKATKQIADGDLDFTLNAEGDDEVSQLFRDFETMRKRLKEAEEERNRFDQENRELISNISHDLKTPVTTVKGYVEGIMDGVADTPEKMDRYIKTIYNKANEMDRLINELTFYSKIDTNRIPYHFTVLNVAAYFEDCAEEVCIDLEERGIHFSYSNHVDRDVNVIGDPEQLERVIHNMISNSVKYIDKETGEIELIITDEGDFIQVALSDNGKGIDPKDLAYVFDRFYRADTSRNSEKGGSGIGLSIVKKIIEDHGGKVWATSRPGRGTTMYFVLRKSQVTLQK